MASTDLLHNNQEQKLTFKPLSILRALLLSPLARAHSLASVYISSLSCSSDTIPEKHNITNQLSLFYRLYYFTPHVMF